MYFTWLFTLFLRGGTIWRRDIYKIRTFLPTNPPLWIDPVPTLFGPVAYNLHFWNPGSKGFHWMYCLFRVIDWIKFKYDSSTKISIFFQFLVQDTVFRVAVQGRKIKLEASNFICSLNNPHRVNKTFHGDEL